MTQRQVVNAGEAEKIYYVYDSTGHRVRKVRENSGGTKREDRFYLGVFEVYRKYGQAGVIKFERETLHIMQDNRRIALVETKIIDDSMPSATSLRPLLRYQFSNHLDSTALELDDLGALISMKNTTPTAAPHTRPEEPPPRSV
jgi:hypothetical protein